ncbi:MAG TPA: hypothetical protein VFL70_02265, partial [Bacteroidia bacterium]|nr:hypothetical protein [Bacteroidia bacterium]
MKIISLHFLFLIVLFLFISNNCLAQVPKTFTADSTKFLSEIDEYFSSIKGKEKEGHEFIKEQFKPFWFGGYLNNEKRQFVYSTSISLLQKKLRPFPDFYNFYNSLISFFTKTKLQETSFQSWKTSLEKLIAKSSAKKLSDFLEASNDIFTSSKLYQSPSVEWFTDNNNFDFQYDSLPKIIFSKINLFCAVKADTANITGTTGVYYPTEKKWIGNGGKVTWKRAGIDENSVYADLKKYSINTTKSGYTADSVTFTNKIYFQAPLLGRLDEKAVPDADVENATHPRFESYSTHFEISNIAEGKVDFSGGFSLRGSKFIGSGNEASDAFLYFKRNNKPLVRAASKTFIFRKDRITCDDAAITMFFDKDSVYHPSIKLKFDIDKKELILIRTMDGISKTPYFNTFHKVDMHVEEIIWKLDSAKMDFRALAAAQGVADFSSMNYYRDKVYSDLQGMDQLNPLVALKQCAEKLGRTTITGEEYARFRHAEAQAIRPYLVPIANGGFIMYDPEEDKIVLQERLFTYLKAKTGKVDYDVIGIHSEVPGGYTNAVLNLLNYDLKIFGVSQIILSDSQNVAIYPLRSQIILKKNRDFFFGGVVQAGKFTYFGKDYYFDYDKFKIDINNGDSIMFTVSKFTPDAFGNYPDVKVKSVIEQVKGDIQIDYPSNKSGRVSRAQYPIFTSAKESFVYYDRRSIQRG